MRSCVTRPRPLSFRALCGQRAEAELRWIRPGWQSSISPQWAVSFPHCPQAPSRQLGSLSGPRKDSVGLPGSAAKEAKAPPKLFLASVFFLSRTCTISLWNCLPQDVAMQPLVEKVSKAGENSPWTPDVVRP